MHLLCGSINMQQFVLLVCIYLFVFTFVVCLPLLCVYRCLRTRDATKVKDMTLTSHMSQVGYNCPIPRPHGNETVVIVCNLLLSYCVNSSLSFSPPLPPPLPSLLPFPPSSPPFLPPLHSLLPSPSSPPSSPPLPPLPFLLFPDRVIAMSFPSSGSESLYRNSIQEVGQFLDAKHFGHYRVYNLCCM